MMLRLFKRQRGGWFVSIPQLQSRNRPARPTRRERAATAPSILSVVDSNMVDDLAWAVFNRLLIPTSVPVLLPVLALAL